MSEEKHISSDKPPKGIIAELLVCLQEELNEVGQRINKAQRFGLNEVQSGQALTNEERIVYELADLETVIDLLHEHGVLKDSQKGIDNMKALKRLKLKKYLQQPTQTQTHKQ